MANGPANQPVGDKERFDYAWNWFAYHADQRLKMFNFMLIALGVFANSIVAAINGGSPLVAASLCVVGGMLSLAFRQLDRRNQDLTWIGEDVLAHLETEWLFKPAQTIPPFHEKPNRDKVAYNILPRQKTDDDFKVPDGIQGIPKGLYLGRHRLLLKGTATLLAIFFFAGAVLIPLFFHYLHTPAPKCCPVCKSTAGTSP